MKFITKLALTGIAFAAPIASADAQTTVYKGYDASNSSGSNLAPTSKALADRVTADVAAAHKASPGISVPADLVTTSASGLDPDLSPEAALYQVDRVARARGLSADGVRALVAAQTDHPLLGLIGEPHVNVLALNRALDRATTRL